MQVEPAAKDQLETGMYAGSGYCGAPKKVKIHNCKCVFLFFGPVEHPKHLIWLYFGFESLGILMDLQEDKIGTRWTTLVLRYAMDLP